MVYGTYEPADDLLKDNQPSSFIYDLNSLEMITGDKTWLYPTEFILFIKETHIQSKQN